MHCRFLNKGYRGVVMGPVALGFSQSNKSPFSFGEGRGGDEVSYVLPPPAQGTVFKDCGLEQAFGKFCLSPCIMPPNLAKIRSDAANVLNRQLSVRSLLRGLQFLSKGKNTSLLLGLKSVNLCFEMLKC